MRDPSRDPAPEPSIEDLRKRRFALFAYDNYYPGGGWRDLLGLFAREEEARVAIERHRAEYLTGIGADHYDIIDLWTEEP